MFARACDPDYLVGRIGEGEGRMERGSAADYQLFISEGADRSGKKHICVSAARSAAHGSRILSRFRLLILNWP